MLSFIPIYVYFGVRRKYEIYILMIVSSIIISPFTGIVRAMMADMIPEGYSSTIMSFEGLLENVTTWIGPLMVGAILDATNSLRLGILALEIFILIGFPFILYTNLKLGREDRVKFESSL